MHAATAPSPRLPLGLAPHVRARSSEGQVILLDLRSGRYIGIGPAASAALSHSIEGWPCVLSDPNVAATPPAPISSGTLIQRLADQGLLSNSRNRPSPWPNAEAIPRPEASLDFEDLSMQIEIGTQSIACFLKAAALSALRLRFQSMETMALAVSARRARRQRALTSQMALPAAQLASMCTHAIAYEWLRPFLFTSHRKCLFDSLTLLEFLSSKGLFPYWVIGVKTNPFGAHSWVQYGSMVLNDQHARVRQFRPILVA